MDFKFKKGERVHVLCGELYPSVFRGGSIPVTKGPGLRINDRRLYQGTPQYKIECFTGWWDEKSLVLAPEQSKFTSGGAKAAGAITYTPEETKCDTGDSGASENLWEVISELSDIRAGYNAFDAEEQKKYHALTVAIQKLREELVDED